MRTLPYLSSRGAKRRGDLLTLLVLLLLSFAAPAASAQTTVCPGLTGWQALACIRADYTPTTVLDYDTARDSLFSHVWADRSPHYAHLTIEGIYGGQRSGLSTYQNTARDVRIQAQTTGFNTEHIWPQSRGADQGDAHNDLHHLAPAWGIINSARSNRPFGSAFSQWPDTYKWHKGRSTRYANASNGPPQEPALYSRVERDFLSSPDNGDDWTSLAEMGRFDVRHIRRGDVARMAAYFLAIYQIEAEDGSEGRAFIERTLDKLLDWHETDLVDADEDTRNSRIAAIQGNLNPFTLDPTLMRRALYQGTRERPPTAAVWINELHYANEGADQGEGVEIAGPAGTDLYGYRLWFYAGSGRTYGADFDPTGDTRSHRLSLSATLSGTHGSGHLGALWIPAAKLRGGCNGLALIAPNGAVQQFLSYGGCRFNALAGPVYDFAGQNGATAPSHPDSLVWSDAITAPGRWGAQQWSALAPGRSIQLIGSGDSYAEFTWSPPTSASPGALNSHQSHVTSLPSARSGGTGNVAVTLALDARSGPDGQTLTIAPLYPNPARDRIRFDASAPVDVALFDALGRRVHLPTPSSGGAQRRGDLQTAHLPPGLYLARFTTIGSGSTVTRTFTVVR